MFCVAIQRHQLLIITSVFSSASILKFDFLTIKILTIDTIKTKQ